MLSIGKLSHLAHLNAIDATVNDCVLNGDHHIFQLKLKTVYLTGLISRLP